MLVWRRWVFPVLMVLVFGVIAASLAKIAFFPDEQRAAAEASGGISDPVVAVARGDVVSALSLPGSVARDASFPIRSEDDGTVTEIHVGEGQAVAAGQALFSIKRSENSRTVDVVAPEAGNVSKITVVRGQPASVGAELATLAPARFHVLSTVEPAQLYRLLNAPSEAQVTIPGGPAPFTCTGLDIQVAEDSTTSVRCAIPADQVVFPGLPATMDIAVGTAQGALVIPTTAVRGGSGTGTVWVDKGDGTAPEERTISLGLNDGTLVAVTDGLTEGESVRQFVPGFAAPTDEMCYDDGQGNQVCQPGPGW